MDIFHKNGKEFSGILLLADVKFDVFVQRIRNSPAKSALRDDLRTYYNNLKSKNKSLKEAIEITVRDFQEREEKKQKKTDEEYSVFIQFLKKSEYDTGKFYTTGEIVDKLKLDKQKVYGFNKRGVDEGLLYREIRDLGAGAGTIFIQYNPEMSHKSQYGKLGTEKGSVIFDLSEPKPTPKERALEVTKLKTEEEKEKKEKKVKAKKRIVETRYNEFKDFLKQNKTQFYTIKQLSIYLNETVNSMSTCMYKGVEEGWCYREKVKEAGKKASWFIQYNPEKVAKTDVSTEIPIKVKPAPNPAPKKKKRWVEKKKENGDSLLLNKLQEIPDVKKSYVPTNISLSEDVGKKVKEYKEILNRKTEKSIVESDVINFLFHYLETGDLKKSIEKIDKKEGS